MASAEGGDVVGNCSDKALSEEPAAVRGSPPARGQLRPQHRLNMELDLQSLFGHHVT